MTSRIPDNPCAALAPVEICGAPVLCQRTVGHQPPHRYRNGGEVMWWDNKNMIITGFMIPGEMTGGAPAFRFL